TTAYGCLDCSGLRQIWRSARGPTPNLGSRVIRGPRRPEEAVVGEPLKGQAAAVQTPSSGGEARLRRNAVGLTGTVIMSAAIMGPAVSTFFNPQFSTPFSGFATPFVYLVTLIIMLIVANGIMEMARVAPSAGSFYTYITRALGPRAGFTTGGLMFV